MATQAQINEQAGKFWDRRLEELRTNPLDRVRWWQDETTLPHINGLLGEPTTSALHFAFHTQIAKRLEGRQNLKGVSIGCGMGTKELWLMQMVDITHFDLFDIAEANIESGRQEAQRQGVLHKVNMRVEDAFVTELPDDYDLVYWNNALHHMPNVYAALRWSFDRLKPSALLAMDDFIGPSRFQWTDRNLAWASRVRTTLPPRLLMDPDGDPVSNIAVRPTIEQVKASDPSEAADSGRTVEALQAVFPSVEIFPTGGALYHLALNDIFHNSKSEEDLTTLRQILLLDQCRNRGLRITEWLSPRSKTRRKSRDCTVPRDKSAATSALPPAANGSALVFRAAFA
jgi:SAM-dependent methyltransferase